MKLTEEQIANLKSLDGWDDFVAADEELAYEKKVAEVKAIGVTNIKKGHPLYRWLLRQRKEFLDTNRKGE